MRAVQNLTFLLALSASVGLPVISQPVRAAEPLTADSLRVHTLEDDDKSVYLIGDDMQLNGEQELVITGDAQVRRVDSVSKGDVIRYHEKSGQVKVRGNGLLMQQGSIVRSPSIDYNLNSEEGELDDPQFWLTGGAAGYADHGTIFSNEHLRLKNMSYSACPCPEPSWWIKAPRVDLYTDQNEGVARNGVLYFKGVPLFYSPYFSFPLREERKSGFLTPLYSYSSNASFEFAAPYYFNLAPNYDATVTPRFLSKRGLQLEAEGRYLGRSYEGIVAGTYINKDKVTQTKRWLIDAQHRQNLGKGFGFSYAYRRVSDDDYFRDFTTLDLGASTTSELLSNATLTWSGYKYFNASLVASQYQVLQDPGSGYRQEYSRMPSFSLRGARYNWAGFDVTSENEITRFSVPYYSGSLRKFDEYRRSFPGETVRNMPEGVRASSYTAISYPMVRAAGYITPKVGLHLSHYDTDWKGLSGNNPRRDNVKIQNRVVPLYSVDSGLYFERSGSLFGMPTMQTLEPRAFYLYVPYRDQRQLPLYDTSVATFNMSQAFSDNIYSGGWDRIANANQLTLGLTSRWLDADTGFERMSLSVAQRLYFDDQRVFLYDNPSVEYPPTRRRSDYLFEGQVALTDQFRINLGGQINPETRHRNRMSAGVRWQPKRLATIAANYRYERDPRSFDSPTNIYQGTLADRTKERVSLTTQWPLTQKLYALGRLDYSLQEKRSTQSILGMEYKGDCCWTARVVVQRYAVSSEKSNSTVFFQLELSGLGSLGTDPMSLLRDRIVGYETVTPPIPETTTFERYE